MNLSPETYPNELREFDQETYSKSTDPKGESQTSDPRIQSVYQGSIYGLLQRSAVRSRQSCFVLCVTSAHRGSGVSYLSKLLVEALNREEADSAVLIGCHGSFSVYQKQTELTEEFNLWIRSQAPALLAPRRPTFEVRDECVRQLRSRFSYVILDCASLDESSEVLSLATVADGVVSVVEANRTTKRQIASIERSITQSNGTLLGHILNKRKSVLPTWLDKQLGKMGI